MTEMMTNEQTQLIPCDHCGKEVYLKQVDGRWCIDDPTCERHHWEADAPCKYPGKEGLIEWWNTRYKRTCSLDEARALVIPDICGDGYDADARCDAIIRKLAELFGAEVVDGD